jgi:hypothetical protein
MPRNEGGDVQKNEDEHRTSEGADVGQRSDELNVHNVPEHHLARHQKSVAVVDANDIQAILKRMNYKINFIVFRVCILRTSENGMLINQIHPAVSAHRLSTCRMLFTSPRKPKVREGRSEVN